MAEERKGPSGAEAPKGKRATASGRPQPDQLPRLAAEAYNDYATAISDALAQSDPTGRARDAYGEYLQRAGADWTPQRMAERYAEASRIYIRALQAYFDPEQDNLEAYRAYILELSEQWRPEESQAQARDAYRRYLDGLGDALDPGELERGTQEAWGEYVGRLKEVYGQLDASADPETVAALARSALTAAAATQAVREVVKQRQAARESVAAARPA